MDGNPLESSPLTYQDLEPFLDAQVVDPLPSGIIDPEWLREPEIQPEWLREPEIQSEWLREPEIQPEWLQSIETESVDYSLDSVTLNMDLDLEH